MSICELSRWEGPERDPLVIFHNIVQRPELVSTFFFFFLVLRFCLALEKVAAMKGKFKPNIILVRVDITVDCSSFNLIPMRLCRWD
jgi:hypothetical protein